MISDSNNCLMDNCLWNSDAAFLRKGVALFQDDSASHELPIHWSFQKINTKNLPISFVKCRMEGMGYSSSGFGDCFQLKHSMQQAFAEAWERLWMNIAGEKNLFEPFKINSSNGFAAGTSANEAISKSRGELIERAMLLSAWREQIAWKSHSTSSFLTKILCRFFDYHDWRIDYFMIEGSKTETVLVILARHRKLGAMFDAAYIPDKNQTAKTELKIMKSLLRQLCLKQSENETWINNLPDIGKPWDHALFYGNPEHLLAFNFLDRLQTPYQKLYLPDSQEIISRIIVPAGKFPAVACSLHPQWPELVWGKHSIQGKNPWPHPLA